MGGHLTSLVGIDWLEVGWLILALPVGIHKCEKYSLEGTEFEPVDPIGHFEIYQKGDLIPTSPLTGWDYLSMLCS